MTRRIRHLFAILPGIILLGMMSRTAPCQPAPLRIALSKAAPNYVNWLKKTDPGVLTVDLFHLSYDEAVRELSRCGGLLLTGGEDVYPGRYGKEADTARCTEIDPRRDTLEFLLIREALQRDMPVMGICRGQQILNVALGGSLVIDIPQDHPDRTVHQCDDYLKCFHMAYVGKGTLLGRLCACDSAVVTTNHHQAVDRLARGLTAGARSAGGLIESIERPEPGQAPFLIGVQWHPERMDLSNPLSGPLATEFLRQATLYMDKKLQRDPK